MTQTEIRHDTDLEQLRKQIGPGGERARLRQSNARREYLEKLASINIGESVYVHVSGNEAYADIAGKDSETGFTDRMYVNIPAEEQEQPASDLDGEVWDLLFQKTELYHELGHVLYTDWPSFETVMFDVDSRYRDVYKMWWNILEDAAIERLLGDRFNIKNDLKLKNANLLNAHTPGTAGSVTLTEGAAVALMEYKHPTGTVIDLLDDDERPQFAGLDLQTIFEDEMLPVIENDAPEIIAEDDPVERNQLFDEMFEKLVPALETQSASRVEISADALAGDPDDGERRGDGSEGQAPPTSDGDDDDDSEDHPHTRTVKAEFEVAKGEVDEDDADLEELEGSNATIDVQGEYNEEIQQEREQPDSDSTESEAESFLRIIQTNYEMDNRELVLGVGSSEVFSVTDDPSDKLAEARRLSNPLAQEFGQRLRQERKTSKKSGQRWGKLDGKNLHKTERGSTRVFKREGDPDEKDYNAVLLLDRSSSMRGQVRSPEIAIVAVALALERVGVDVSIISYFAGGCHLDLPFGTDVEQKADELLHGNVQGGTPMSDALRLARERLEEKGGHPFIINITDGEPNHREAYRDELHYCDFPVLGLYVDSPMPDDNARKNEATYFDQLVTEHVDNTFDGMRTLTKRVMF